jgi:hypothetical protein
MGKKLRRGEKIIPFQTTNYQVLSGWNHAFFRVYMPTTH